MSLEHSLLIQWLGYARFMDEVGKMRLLGRETTTQYGFPLSLLSALAISRQCTRCNMTCESTLKKKSGNLPLLTLTTIYT